jgi:signal transduction histidine kinase
VHRHGGRIWADATPGKGAVFFFTLAPGKAQPAEAAKKEVAA